jgi:guanylate kinase
MVGPLIILSGPSGSGKTTIVGRLRAMPELRLRPSISATTRPKRQGEIDGEQYFFLTSEEFERRRQAGEFLEWAEVHGHKYGTPRAAVEAMRKQGYTVILVIDVKGAEQVRPRCPDAMSIFLTVSSLDTLEQRLRDRHTEDEVSLRRRLANARVELTRAGEFTHQVLNDDLEQAVADVRTIIMNRILEGETQCSTS